HQIEALAARKQLFRFPPQPVAYSLALAETQGSKRDPEVLPLVRVAISKPVPGGAPAPALKSEEGGTGAKGETDAKRAPKEPPLPTNSADAIEKLRTKPHRDVAAAAFELVATDPDPSPEKIRQLLAVVQIQEPRPRYIETLFLERLAEASM